MGNSLEQIRAFPSSARQDAGFQIDKVQRGENPDEWKPMKTVGKSVKEIQIREVGDQFRVIYLTNLEDTVYALLAFQKKTQKTRKPDIDPVLKRLSLAGDQNG